MVTRLRALRQRWFPSESFDPRNDRIGWWRLGALSCAVISALTLLAVTASTIAGPGPDEATGTVVASECREVRENESRRALYCDVRIEFDASDGERIAFGRTYRTDLDEPIAIGAVYTVFYDNQADRLPTRKAKTDLDRDVSFFSRMVGSVVFAGGALVFLRRATTGRWPLTRWLVRRESIDGEGDDDASAG